MAIIRLIKLIVFLSIYQWRKVESKDGCSLNFFSGCYQTEVQLITDPDSVRKVCDAQALLKAMVCMDQMRTTCETELRLTIDNTGSTDGMALYCQNVDLIADNSACTQAAESDVKKCFSSLRRKFYSKMAQRNISMNSDPRLIMQQTCELSEETVDCVDHKLAKTCPGKVRDILTQVSRMLTQATCTFGRVVEKPMTQSPATEGTGSANTFCFTTTLLMTNIVLNLIFVYIRTV